VNQCLGLASKQIALGPAIKLRALELESPGIGAMDALHAACAEVAGCSHLLTCDDRLRKRYQGPITLLNPADFVVAYFQQTP
jgi:predicted nucleic acid-binding protein